MVPQAYKVVSTHAHEILECTILSRILRLYAPRIGVINGYIRSDLATMAFKNGEQIEDFHSRILRLQQKIILSVETVSPTRLILHYMETLSKSDN